MLVKLALPWMLMIPPVPKVAMSSQLKLAVSVFPPSKMLKLPVPVTGAVSRLPEEVMVPTPNVPSIRP